MKPLSILVITAAFSACKTQPTEPGMATIKGHAWTAAWYSDYVSPYSGITVSLDGTNFSTTTDDSGAYELDNVPSGTYNVRFTKPGYGEIR